MPLKRMQYSAFSEEGAIPFRLNCCAVRKTSGCFRTPLSKSHSPSPSIRSGAATSEANNANLLTLSKTPIPGRFELVRRPGPSCGRAKKKRRKKKEKKAHTLKKAKKKREKKDSTIQRKSVNLTKLAEGVEYTAICWAKDKKTVLLGKK